MRPLATSLGPAAPAMPREPVALGLRANWRQFTLLVAINAFVGAMVGLERSVLPLVAVEEFGLTSAFAAASFVGSFGAAKAISNLSAGALSDRFSRRNILISGWLFAIPVPLLIIAAPSWWWIVVANLFLGANQGLAWSMTVNMKIDLAGPKRRGLALGLNEAAGYLAVAATALAAGLVAERWGLRPEPFYLGIAIAATGTALSLLFVRDTIHHVTHESAHNDRPGVSLPTAFAAATWRRPTLVGASQAGFVNNLNDALAWAILPLYFASKGARISEIGTLAATYPLFWGACQLGTGWLSDLTGRRPLIATGMFLQAIALAAIGLSSGMAGWWAGVTLLGIGTALVYPVLLATGDVVAPRERATFLGVYRFWRDGGAVAGALLSGLVAGALGFAAAIQLVAALTAASGIAAWFMINSREVR